jgi:hypothetical protein
MKLLIPLIFAVLILGMISIIPIQDAQAVKAIKKRVLFHETPQFCLFGENEKSLKVGTDSILDWKNQLQSYTNDTTNWNMVLIINPTDIYKCNAEIHFLAKPETEKDRSVKAQGKVEFEKDKAIVEVYTTQYYDESAHRYEVGKDNRARPVPFEFADVPLDLLGKVTRHELGHVFGLKHQNSDSIMISGPRLAEITETDLKGVIEKYGINSWAD